jgi:hypothetical protein
MKRQHSWAWWYTSVISVLRKHRQENQDLEVNLSYIARHCLKTNQKSMNKN